MAIIEAYKEHKDLGIITRPIKEGEEFNLVQDFIEYRKAAFKSSKNRELAIFLETKIGGAYPDILFVEFDPQIYTNWSDQRSRLQTADLKVLYYIYARRNVGSESISHVLSVSHKQLLQSLEKLIDANLIERKNGKWIIRDRKSIFAVKKIEAVEAKINNWGVAIQQAITNCAFASESFVLSNKTVLKENTIQHFRDFGIGIYLFNGNQLLCKSEAKSNKYPVNYNSILVNECLGRILKC